MGASQPSLVRALVSVFTLLVCGAPLSGQAPASANLWRVAATSLAVPPALQGGPVAAHWNPAAGWDTHGLAVGAQFLQTSDVVGISGLLAGASYALSDRIRLGAVFGRIDVRDLVRTTTTPNSEAGSIPVYNQYAGLTGSVVHKQLTLGAVVRLNDARFDAFREAGVTLDIGAHFRPVSELTLAAATHFFPIDFSGRESTDYYAGVQYEIVRGTLSGELHTAVVGRYGLVYRAADVVEHALNAGVTVNGLVTVDMGVVREAAYGASVWRPIVGLDIRIGRYALRLARSNGLNDLGATYRIGLDAVVLQ